MMRIKVRLKFEPRDVWIGVYWDFKKWDYAHIKRSLDIYICIIPMLPIHLLFVSPG